MKTLMTCKMKWKPSSPSFSPGTGEEMRSFRCLEASLRFLTLKKVHVGWCNSNRFIHYPLSNNFHHHKNHGLVSWSLDLVWKRDCVSGQSIFFRLREIQDQANWKVQSWKYNTVLWELLDLAWARPGDLVMPDPFGWLFSQNLDYFEHIRP